MSRRTLGAPSDAGFAPMGDATPGTRSGAVANDDILIRGEAAARARPIDLVAGTDPGDMCAVGPWAEQLERAKEAARDSGFEQGRMEGLAAGLAEARDRLADEHADLSSSVTAMLDGLERRSAELGVQLADQTVDLALEIAEAVLARELECCEDPGADAIARCLDLVPSTGALVVRLNPGDLERLGEIDGLGDRELVVAADPSLSSGDAIVSVDQITIDGRLNESLRRVAETLRNETIVDGPDPDGPGPSGTGPSAAGPTGAGPSGAVSR